MLRRQLQQASGLTEQSRKRSAQSSDKSNAPRRPVHEDVFDDAREAALEEDVLGTGEDILEALPERSQKKQKRKKKRKASEEEEEKKWEDSDDEQAKAEFETVTPSWATTFDDEKSDDSDEEVLKAHSYHSMAASTNLPSSLLDFKRVTDGNKEEPCKASLKCVEFHPKATVLLTGGPDHTLRLFAVDGSKNRKIHSMFLERTPILCSHFSRGGSEVIIGSEHRSFYVYDLEGTSGVTFRPKLKGLEVSTMSNFVVSPDERFLAFLGTHGHIHLFSQKSKELIDTVKMNESVKSLCFSKDGKLMYSFGSEGLVYVWDMNTRDCIHRFHDGGCVDGTQVAVSPDNSYVICGSESGIVSVYGRDNALSTRHPTPIKLIKNLTTTCSGALFNSQSEILALRSKDLEKAVKLVHLPSLSVFPNFPEQFDHDMKLILSMDFSPSSGYLALGNNKGRCLLYRLQHYNKY